MDIKDGIIPFIIVLGFFTGITASVILQSDEISNKRYCGEIENKIQENMTEGFINCYPPGLIDVNLTEEVAKGSNLRCVCRKKVEDRLQVLKITESK